MIKSLFLLFTFSLFTHAADRPNVILIMTDDQGYGDLECHGNPVLKTPELNKLYAESVRFTDFHVSSFCTPTRAALLTGRHAAKTGAFRTAGSRCLMYESQKTIADLFAENGYRTGMVGKWHLGDNAPSRPQDKGFQEVIWHRTGGIGQAADFYGNDYYDDTYERASAEDKNGVWEQAEGYCTDVWFQEAGEFIERNQQKPFFLYLALNAPHGPYIVPKEWAAPYQGNKEVANANFFGMIANIDHNIGILRQKLEELKLSEDTIFIFMTDNGTAAGAKFQGLESLPTLGYNAGRRGKKSSIYAGGIHVPFFIHWEKGNLKGGRDIDTLAAHIDVLPTLAELCGFSVPESYPIDGTSLKPLLEGKDEEWERATLVEQYHGGPYNSTKLDVPFAFASVLTEDWRYVSGSEGPGLYAIKEDLGQQNNLIESHPEVVKELDERYQQYWEEVTQAMKVYPRIHIGNLDDNPTILCTQDWHREGGNPPHAFSQLRKYPKINYPWNVSVQKAGLYQFTLRQFPAEAKLALNDVTKARVEINGCKGEVTVTEGSQEAVVEVNITSAGDFELWTYLDSEKGKSSGAYFTEVEFLK